MSAPVGIIAATRRTPPAGGSWTLDFTDDADIDKHLSFDTNFGGGFHHGVYSGRLVTASSGYVDWYFAKSLYDVPTSTGLQTVRLEAEFTVDNGNVAIFVRSTATGADHNQFILNEAGTWEVNHDAGGIASGSYTPPSLNTLFELEVVISSGPNYTMKFNGTTIASGSLANAAAGLYVGVQTASGAKISKFFVGDT